MNDLENRLRDALDAAAGTIPDSAVAPGMVEPDRHRPRRALVIAIAAAAAVVIAIAVPFISQRDKSAPTQPACPSGTKASPAMQLDKLPSSEPFTVKVSRLPVGAPPGLPYTIASWQSGGGYLQDGNTRVQLPAGMRTSVVERLQCGWLVSRTKLLPPHGSPGETEFGVLQPSGQFTRLGASAGGNGGTGALGLSVGLSPDGTKVAYTSHQASDKRVRLAIVELASGNEVATTQVDINAQILAWNPSGIWLSFFGDGSSRPLWSYAVWQPGSEPRPVQVSGMLYPYRTTDRMVAADIIGPRSCTRVVKLDQSGGLSKLLESCVQAPWSPDPTLSPDGEIVLQFDKARRVADGSVIRSPGDFAGGGTQFAWEDNEHVLLGRGQLVLRCNVKTAACERVYSSKDDQLSLNLVLTEPYRSLGA